MKNIFSRVLFLSLIALCLLPTANIGSTTWTGKDFYVCMPCGQDCDSRQYDQGGTCTDCNMTLVKKSTVKHSSVSPDKLCHFVAKAGKEGIVLLDVRTREEFEGRASQKFGRLANAVNIPIQELEKRMGELEKYKKKTIVVYCSHSHRSPRASYMLTQNGFNYVVNMDDGMSVWKGEVKDEECNKKLYVNQE